MRKLLWLCILLVSLAWLKFETDPLPVAAEQTASPGVWRRTINGWEDRRRWHSSLPAHQPVLHPAVVVAFEVFASLTALLACNARPTRKPTRNEFRVL